MKAPVRQLQAATTEMRNLLAQFGLANVQKVSSKGAGDGSLVTTDVSFYYGTDPDAVETLRALAGEQLEGVKQVATYSMSVMVTRYIDKIGKGRPVWCTGSLTLAKDVRKTSMEIGSKYGGKRIGTCPECQRTTAVTPDQKTVNHRPRGA